MVNARNGGETNQDRITYRPRFGVCSPQALVSESLFATRGRRGHGRRSTATNVPSPRRPSSRPQPGAHGDDTAPSSDGLPNAAAIARITPIGERPREVIMVPSWMKAAAFVA